MIDNPGYSNLQVECYIKRHENDAFNASNIDYKSFYATEEDYKELLDEFYTIQQQILIDKSFILDEKKFNSSDRYTYHDTICVVLGIGDLNNKLTTSLVKLMLKKSYWDNIDLHKNGFRGIAIPRFHNIGIPQLFKLYKKIIGIQRNDIPSNLYNELMIYMIRNLRFL